MTKMAENLDVRTGGKERKTFFVSGFPFPVSSLFTPESTERALTFRPQPSDVILSSYPKCDSKCVDSIVWKLLYMDLKPPPVCSTTNRFLPCMEMSTVDDLLPIYEYTSAHKLPELHKTYLPFKLIPFYKRAKYIYVMRTPWEACASYFNFLRSMDSVTNSFDTFFDDFLNSNVPYGSYFKHIMPWNKRLNENNVLVLCREHVEHNPRSAMFIIAAFLGERYLTQLMNNSEIERSILNATNWDAHRNDNKNFGKCCSVHYHSLYGSFNCISYGDGEVQSYTKPRCNETQLKEMTEKISEKFKDTSTEFLWLSLLKKQSPILFV